MDARDYIAANAAEFSQAPRDWLVYRHHDVQPAALTKEGGSGPEADLAEILGAPLVFVAVGLDADRIHAPNEYVDLSRLLRGAESVAYLWEELAGAGAGA